MRRDRAVVQHHYDVSNAFYRRLLGPSLVYSCAYFASPQDTLDAAQQRKLELICRKLRLRPGERLLDIGCGWGSLLLHAAEHHGVHGVGITLSEEQAALARERVRQAQLADRVEIRALIQRYVFPDGELPPLDRVPEALRRTGLEPRDVKSLREHYLQTLRRWIANLADEHAAIVAEVGPERERVWRLYLIGSALAFADADISVFQILATRPGAAHGLPLVRGDVVAAEPAQAS